MTREMCLFEPIHGRNPNCDEHCERCSYRYVEKEPPEPYREDKDE